MLTLQINGQSRNLDLPPHATVADLLGHLDIKFDRVAVEHNGNIVARASWSTTELASGDRLEVVHFVGGGCNGRPPGIESTHWMAPANDYTEYVLSDIAYPVTNLPATYP